MAHDEARRIIAKYLPRVDAGTSIVETRFPAAAVANRIVGAMGRPVRTGPHYVDPSRAPGFRPSAAAKLVAESAAKSAAGGTGGVDIRVWASALEQAGATAEQIGGAYEAAGGDPVLAEQERRGETSGFLAVFVQGLEDRGIAPEVILGSYEQAGGRIG